MTYMQNKARTLDLILEIVNTIILIILPTQGLFLAPATAISVTHSSTLFFRPNEGTFGPAAPATNNVLIFCNNKICSSFSTSSNSTLSALPQSSMGSPAGPSQLRPNDQTVQTIITDCAPMYSFFSLNVARILKNNSVNKSKINFLNDLSDESTFCSPM